MGKWEYLTFRIGYDRKEHKNWVVKYNGKPPLVGLQAILDAHGADAWELVSLDLERSAAVTGFGKWHLEPVTYRATFKRPIDED
jgi:hypothetical protein